MTLTATEHVTGSPNAAVPPIVLTLNEENAQAYLNANNKVLEALYGSSPVRIDARIGTHYLSREFAECDLLAILRDYPDLPLRELANLLQNTGDSWLTEAARSKVAEQILLNEGENCPHKTLEAVRVVLIDDWVVDNSPVLRNALEPLLPNAAFFRVNDSRRAPTRIWKYPLCSNGHEMAPAGDELQLSPAGTAFECPVCDNTRLQTTASR